MSLKRTTPMPRGEGPKRTPMPPGKARPRQAADPARAFRKPAAHRDTGPSRKVRAAVYERDNHRCACCGTPVIGRPHSVGHRKRRSQGGGHEMSNLLTFLGLGVNPLDPDDHHARIDSRRDPSDEDRGLTVRSWKDPAKVPVTLADGAVVLLGATYVTVPAEGVEAA